MNAELAAAIAELHRASVEGGTRWRNDTPPRIVRSIDDVLRAWRKAQR
jgi:hypothetical protein